MIDITVDFNNDRVVIHNTSYKSDFSYDVEQPVETLKMLEEILNQLAENQGSLGWILCKIDEDTRTMIGEW